MSAILEERNPHPEPFDPMCNRTADQIDSIRDYARAEECTPAEYVEREEGTYNPVNGHFLCDECYITAGMPSSPTGWKCP